MATPTPRKPLGCPIGRVVSSTVERPESGTAETGSRSTAVEWALLDERGVIVAVNDAWRSFSAQNGGVASKGVAPTTLEWTGRTAACVSTRSIRLVYAGLCLTPQ